MKVWLSRILVVAVLVPFQASAATVTFLTSGTSYSTPADWNNSNNTIECIGAGGNGGSGGTTAGSKGAGGGGGAYALISNLTISGSISYSIAGGGSQADTTFNSTSLVCDAGNNASGATAGAGGTTGASTGTTKFAGGTGDIGSTMADGGGGGAGGTTSAGSDGGVSGGGNGGTVSGGTGGAAATTAGDIANPGGNGTVWQVSPARGAGGGGGAGANCSNPDVVAATNGGDGGAYGGGGGGGGQNVGANCTGFGSTAAGAGAQGIIVTTYTPAVVAGGPIKKGMKMFPGGRLKLVGGGLKLF